MLRELHAFTRVLLARVLDLRHHVHRLRCYLGVLFWLGHVTGRRRALFPLFNARAQIIDTRHPLFASGSFLRRRLHFLRVKLRDLHFLVGFVVERDLFFDDRLAIRFIDLLFGSTAL